MYNNGLLKQFVYPGSTKEAYEYTGEGNLSKVTNTKSSRAQISQYTYTYDASGNQDSKAEGGVTTTYFYDNLNRIETIKEGGTAVVAYTYDKAGNILSVTNNYTKDSKLAENFKYDELNRLIEYTDGAGVKTTYTYYPNGLRATKTTGGHTTKYYYDGSNVIIETIDGVLSARNLQGLNYIGRQDAAGNTNYYIYNGHGDVTSTVDSTGAVKNQYTYDVYGYIKTVNETGISSPIRYAGQYYDSESGLYYLRARYYDPRVGRFISEDTNKGDINNPSSLNLYTYCWGNPLKLYDPSGNNPIPYVLESPIGQQILERAQVLGQSFIHYIAAEAPQLANYGVYLSDKIAAADEAVNNTVNAIKDRFNNSSPNNPDPNKWDKKQLIEKYGNYAKMSKQQLESSLKSFEKLRDEHVAKLEQYKENPFAYDNRNILTNAPTYAIRQKIIEGRINELTRQISKHVGEINRIKELMKLKGW